MEIIEIEINKRYEVSSKSVEIDGIQYAQYLRRVERLKNPILFTSYYTLDKELKKTNRSIINAIGHSFLQIPKTDETYNKAIQDLYPLNEIQLSDIIINYCGVRSALTNTFHEFNNAILASKKMEIRDKDKALVVKSIIQNYKLKLLKEYPENENLIREYNRITNLFNENDVSSIDKLLVDDKSLAITIPTEDEDTAKNLKQFSWEVLLLEDNELEIADVKKELESRNIKVHPAKTVKEAKKIINKDETNKITVAISDYRLYQNSSDEHKKMQPEQGYDFLIWLSQQNRFTARVALSGLSKQFLMDSFRKYSANVKVYSKKDLVHNGVNIFVDDIIEMGEAQLEVILHKPKGDAWYKDIIKPGTFSKKLISYYRYHRNHKDYLSYEAEINSIAETVAREMEYNLAKEASFSLECLVSIKGNSTKNLPENIQEGYETFRIKLIQRRIAYYLLFKYLEPYPIYSLLLYGKIDPALLNKPRGKNEIAVKGEKKSSASNKSVYDIVINRLKPVGNFLAINAKIDIPQNLLVEEINFLENIMGFPIKEVSQSMDQTYSYINDYLSDYINANNDLIESLINKKEPKKSFLIKKNNVYTLCTVSLRECNIVLEKIYKHLTKNGKTDLAEKIKNDILSMILNISNLIPATIKNQLELEAELKSLYRDKSEKILEKHFTRITDDFIKRIYNLK